MRSWAPLSLNGSYRQPTAPASRLPARAWWLYCAFGLAGLAAFESLPDGIGSDVVYVVLGASCVVAIIAGVLIHRPARRAPWVLMAAGQTLWVVGDAVGSWYDDVEHVQRYPSLADAFYLSAYPLLAVAMLMLIRGRRRKHDVAGLLDSFTLTAGLALLSWVVLARPTLDASHQSFAAAGVGLAYPVADILLVGMLARLVMTPGARSPTFRFLLAAISLLIAGDTMSAVSAIWTTSTTSFDAVWLVSYIAWGAAALHPAMTRLSEPSTETDVRFTRTRLLALGAATLVAPATLAVQRIVGAPIDVWPVVAGSVLVFVLVIMRMNVAIAQIVVANRDREILQGQLLFQAAHDPLTNLPNRAQALSAIESALNRAHRTESLCGLLFIDLDRFKAVNDTHGHAAGDEVLRETAVRLQGAARSGDVVSRLGGDEFVVLLESLGVESEALRIANRLIDVLAEPITVGTGRTVCVGASVGMAISRDGSTDASRLLHEADTAVYRAKAAGRGLVGIFDESLRRELAERIDLEEAIRVAIENDELRVHYQPVVDLPTLTVHGFEALVRWERPGHGLVEPAHFIPAAEASALICDLDTWVLRQATAQVARWNGQHGTAMIAVNISRRHISAPKVVDDVQQALAASGLPADRLILEITETVLDDDLLAIDHCQQIRALGVAISIDDWGTGYNSLTRLEHLPIDIIKIDRTFLDTSHKSNRVLLELMINAAHAFGLPVVVEGVEHLHQLELLRTLGCEAVQGFYLSYPVVAEEAARLLTEPLEIATTRR